MNGIKISSSSEKRSCIHSYGLFGMGSFPKRVILASFLLALCLSATLALSGCDNDDADSVEEAPVETVAHEIYFETAGGTTIDSASLSDGEQLIAPEEPSKDGYVFDGWNLDSGFTQACFFPFDVDESLPENIILYCKWNEALIEEESMSGSTGDPKAIYSPVLQEWSEAAEALGKNPTSDTADRLVESSLYIDADALSDFMIDSASDIGYVILDRDSNGSSELYIVYIYEGGQVRQAYVISDDGSIETILSGWSRSAWHFGENGTLFRFGSNGADDSFWNVYVLDDDVLSPLNKKSTIPETDDSIKYTPF